MSTLKRVLIVGETWTTVSTHTKGFDSFTTASLGEGYSFLKQVLEVGGFSVDVITNHDAAISFPTTLAALQAYSTIILSDIGANTLLLTPATWTDGKITVNRVQLIADYVQAGGGLIMVGGYLTFTGIEGKGCWRGTAVEAVLPVRLSPYDDRCERPEGAVGHAVNGGHPVLAGVSGTWPALLGYNRVVAAEGAEVIAKIGDDPLIALGHAGKGRSAVFTSDCSPHWCPVEFTAWPGYAAIWRNLCDWTAAVGQDRARCLVPG